MADINTIGVVGLGTVGTAVAAAAQAAGLKVASVEQGGDLSVLSGADLVFEATPEQIEGKEAVLAAIAAAVSEDTVIATSASVLSVTELALVAANPSRVIGLQFANPLETRLFVEVVRTALADASAVAAGEALAEKLGLDRVTVADRPGHISHGLLLGYLNHAVSMYAQKYASRDDIDAAMRFGCGLPIGPLAMIDQMGVDTVNDLLVAMHNATGSRVHAPNPVLKQMVTAGLLGQKSGKGFYTYAAAGSAEIVADADAAAAAGAGAAARAISKVAVIGSGTMANGIMEVFAKAGYDVVAVARSAEKTEASKAAIAKNLGRAVEKGKLSEEDRDATLARVSGAAIEDLGDVDLVVEAVAEDLDIKREIFRKLDAICKPGAVLATTTSSLPVIECAAVTSRPQDVVGLHFFNPAPIMKLVEIVTTVQTGADVIATALEVCAKTKKSPVLCGDRAGFIVNALLFPYLNDAVLMLEDNYATMDEIDLAITKGSGYPMGPFALLDVVGNDVSLAIEQVLTDAFKEPGFTPAETLEHLVAAGYMGRKTGRGFRSYTKK